MQLNEETRLQDLADQYPWMIDKVASLDPRLRVAKTPFGRMMISKATIADASRMSGYPAAQIIEGIRKLLQEYGEA